MHSTNLYRLFTYSQYSKFFIRARTCRSYVSNTRRTAPMRGVEWCLKCRNQSLYWKVIVNFLPARVNANGRSNHMYMLSSSPSLFPPLQVRYPFLINSARGMGTFCSIDCCDVDTRNETIRRHRRKGNHTHRKHSHPPCYPHSSWEER